jgi:acetolactate synthase small subunit
MTHLPKPFGTHRSTGPGLTLNELEQLAENLAGASNHTEDQSFRAEVDRLYDKVDALIDLFRPSESNSIAQAEAWLVKRKWRAW